MIFRVTINIEFDGLKMPSNLYFSVEDDQVEQFKRHVHSREFVDGLPPIGVVIKEVAKVNLKTCTVYTEIREFPNA